MYNFPIEFEFSSTANDRYSDKWSSVSFDFEAIHCDIPKKFKGMGNGFSPEELFGLSLLNCFVATYKFYCMQSELTFEKLKARGTLVVDRGEGGKPCMQKFIMVVTLFNVSDVVMAQKLFLEAEQNCFVRNSVKTECDFSLVIS